MTVVFLESSSRFVKTSDEIPPSAVAGGIELAFPWSDSPEGDTAWRLFHHHYVIGSLGSPPPYPCNMVQAGRGEVGWRVGDEDVKEGELM